MTRLDPQPWMTAPSAVKLMAALGEARFVGGAVRNALLGTPVNDVDIATPHVPQRVCELLQAAGIRTVPTGIEHGTVTAVVDGKPYEVTTLRRDVETDGRRAVVAFTTDWAEDAQRRDFTMNALYVSANGEVFDTVGGVADLQQGRVRFVGDPSMRIREDYLRILRLFRFHAWYGRGELDKAAQRAAAQEKDGIANLSGERIAKEMLRLLEAEHPAPVLKLMAQSGILARVLPAEPDLQRLESLSAIDAAHGFAPDALLRLGALVPAANPLEFAERLAARWKLSNIQHERLRDMAGATELPVPPLPAAELHKLLYRLGPACLKDRLMLAWAERPDCPAQWQALLALAKDWKRPHFSLNGADVMAAGVPQGPKVGEVLQRVETWWIENGFPDDRAELDRQLKEAIKAVA
jgi:poly(A) polymerase